MIDHANKQRGVQYYIIFLVLVNVVNWLFLFVTSHYIGDFAGLRVSVEPSVVLLMLVASLLPFLFLGHLLKKTSSRIAHAAHFNEKAWIIFSVILFITNLAFIEKFKAGVLGVVWSIDSPILKLIYAVLSRIRYEFLAVFLISMAKKNRTILLQLVMLFVVAAAKHSIFGFYLAIIILVVVKLSTSGNIRRKLGILVFVVLLSMPLGVLLFQVRDTMRGSSIAVNPEEALSRFAGRVSSLSNTLVSIQESYFYDTGNRVTADAFFRQALSALFGNWAKPAVTIEQFYQMYYGRPLATSSIMPGFPGVIIFLLRKNILYAISSLVLTALAIQLSFRITAKKFGAASLNSAVVLYSIPVIAGVAYDIFSVLLFFVILVIIESISRIRLGWARSDSYEEADDLKNITSDSACTESLRLR